MKNDVTCPKTDMIRADIWEWLVSKLSREDYRIEDAGFLISTYYLSFANSDAEVYFNLVWGDQL